MRAPSAPQKRLVVLHRHVEKTGGTSLRMAFVRSSCQYFGYDFHFYVKWRLMTFVQNHSVYERAGKPPNELHNNRSDRVACVEAHSPAPNASDFVALGAEARLWDGVRVVLVVVVRSPAAHYASFFRWSHPVLYTNETSASYTTRLLRWAPPNLQSNILARSARASFAARWCCDGRSNPHPTCCTDADVVATTDKERSKRASASASVAAFEAGERLCSRILESTRLFDALLTTEDLSRVGFPLLRRLTGLALPGPIHHKVQPMYANPPWRSIGSAARQPPPKVPFETDDFVARIRAVAPCDWRLHQLAVARSKADDTLNFGH